MYGYVHPDQPRTHYMFSPYQGTDFLDDWRLVRLGAVKALAIKGRKSARAAAIAEESPDRFDRMSDAVFVEPLLRRLSCALPQFSYEDCQAIEMLRRRFEATHVLRIMYSADWRKVSDRQVSIDSYVSFAVTIAHAAAAAETDTCRVQLLNCLLKLNDKCIANLHLVSHNFTASLVQAIEMEMQLVEDVRRKAVRHRA